MSVHGHFRFFVVGSEMAVTSNEDDVDWTKRSAMLGGGQNDNEWSVGQE